MSPPGETATEVAGRAGTSPCLAHPTHPGPATDLGDGLGVTSHEEFRYVVSRLVLIAKEREAGRGLW